MHGLNQNHPRQKKQTKPALKHYQSKAIFGLKKTPTINVY